MFCKGFALFLCLWRLSGCKNQLINESLSESELLLFANENQFDRNQLDEPEEIVHVVSNPETKKPVKKAWEPPHHMERFVTSRGYPLQVFPVMTDDGFLLHLFRIPYGRRTFTYPFKTPVLLMHGFLMTSENWVHNDRTSGLAFALADANYDVWLGNFRGNKYGRRHTTLNTTNSEFWDFCLDQHVTYDLPAIINFILWRTLKSQLMYIGHSMGTASIFALLASQSEYNYKVKGIIALAPIANLGYSVGPFMEIVYRLQWLTQFLPRGEAFSIEFVNEYLMFHLCPPFDTKDCFLIWRFTLGYDPVLMPGIDIPIVLPEIIGAGSFKQLYHFMQSIVSKTFRRFDYGTIKNLLTYFQVSPPDYNLDKVHAPVALIWGVNDVFANPLNVAWLLKHLPNVIVDYEVPFLLYNHEDFLRAVNNSVLLNPTILDLLVKMNV